MFALDENAVSQAVVRWLEDQGYQARAIRAGQHGIDVAAWHPDTLHRWAIEAKGAASSKKGSRRIDRPLSDGVAYGAVSKALLNTIFWTGITTMRGTSIGLACPSDRYFDMWLDRIEPACAVLGISIFRVGTDGEVKCSPKHPVDRPAPLLTPRWPMPRSLQRNFELPPYED